MHHSRAAEKLISIQYSILNRYSMGNKFIQCALHGESVERVITILAHVQSGIISTSILQSGYFSLVPRGFLACSSQGCVLMTTVYSRPLSYVTTSISQLQHTKAALIIQGSELAIMLK